MSDIPFRPFLADAHAISTNETDKVIALEHYATSNQPSDFPACSELLKYWQTLTGSRQMPARQEFDPRGIENTLASTFVAEKVAPNVARIRVSGSLLNDALGMEVRGMPITALFDPCARGTLAEATREVFEAPSMAVLELCARRSFNRKPLRARMLLLPMSDSYGKVSRLVGCLDIQGGLGKTPRRFQISEMRHSTLAGVPPVASVEDVMPTPIVRPVAPIPSYAFAEDAVAFNRKSDKVPKTTTKRNGLRLVVNNA